MLLVHLHSPCPCTTEKSSQHTFFHNSLKTVSISFSILDSFVIKYLYFCLVAMDTNSNAFHTNPDYLLNLSGEEYLVCHGRYCILILFTLLGNTLILSHVACILVLDYVYVATCGCFYLTGNIHMSKQFNCFSWNYNNSHMSCHMIASACNLVKMAIIGVLLNLLHSRHMASQFTWMKHAYD